MIRDCAVIAVEGSQAAGKTTLALALTAHYREAGVHVAVSGEPARVSPFMEEAVLYGGRFDAVAELDAFAAHLMTAARTARHHRLLIADRTPASVIAYSRHLLDLEDPLNGQLIHAMEATCRAWMPNAYDAVVYCRDRYNQRSGGDRYREKVLDLQGKLDRTIYEVCAGSGVKLIELPTELDTASRVRWIAECVTDMGLLLS
ncbi:AAA family ATPase [Kitasatospora sp. NPDC096140]|uniref:AAA family ATPase n=1 Tax=Kitasatospora sp. NPDC096140 TaxID=3155425 RepID=UPI003330B878